MAFFGLGNSIAGAAKNFMGGNRQMHGMARNVLNALPANKPMPNATNDTYQMPADIPGVGAQGPQKPAGEWQNTMPRILGSPIDMSKGPQMPNLDRFGISDGTPEQNAKHHEDMMANLTPEERTQYDAFNQYWSQQPMPNFPGRIGNPGGEGEATTMDMVQLPDGTWGTRQQRKQWGNQTGAINPGWSSASSPQAPVYPKLQPISESFQPQAPTYATGQMGDVASNVGQSLGSMMGRKPASYQSGYAQPAQ